MRLRLLCQRSAGLRPSGEQIRQRELGSDMNRGRDLVSSHEMVELDVRCRLTQPLQIRLVLDSLRHHIVPPLWWNLSGRPGWAEVSPPLRSGTPPLRTRAPPPA